MNNLKKISILFIWIAGTLYLSFQYFRIADFPIGHDVINHIQRSLAMQQNMNIASIFKETIYPIPALLFVWFYDFFHKFFGWDWPRVFLFTECFFLFLTAIISGIFSWIAFKKWPIVIGTSFLVASSRWLNGSLYTGLMGEAFGWAAFMVCLILLFQRKWLWFIPAFIFLAFSHPIPFGVMCVFLVVYLIYHSVQQKKYWFLLISILGFSALFLVGYYLFPEKRDLIISILHTKFPIEGEYKREYVIGSDFRRFNQYLLGFLGFITLWLGKVKLEKEKKQTLLLFSVLSFLVTFKYLFGIHYLSFRYFTYFEIMNSVVAAFMIWHIADNLSEIFKSKFKRSYILYSVFCILLFLAVWPNVNATAHFVPSNLSENTATTTPIPERTLLKEASQNMKIGSFVLGQRRWVWWFHSYGMYGINSDNNFDYLEKIYEHSPNDFLTQIKLDNTNYIYLSSVDEKYGFESANFLKRIYNRENIRIYEIQ